MNNEPLTNNQLPIGTRLGPRGRYRIDDYLRNGGFGKTYVGTDLQTSCRIAIKELFIKGLCGRNTDGMEVSISLSENRRTFEDHQRKFRVEAERIKQFNNRHIVHVYDLFDGNGTTYYVMDFIDGLSLSQLLDERGGPLSPDEAMGIFYQLLDGLETIHNGKTSALLTGNAASTAGAPLLHLDIKPGNILIDKSGNVVIIDFGASKQLHDAEGNSVSTSDIAAFTEGYAPIELAVDRNLHYLGPWTDIYSLGATLYRMLTYKRLPTPSEMINGGEHVLSFPPEVDERTRRLIFWMMKSGIADRPQNVAQVREFLAADDSEEIMGMIVDDAPAQTPSLGNVQQPVGAATNMMGAGGNPVANGPMVGPNGPMVGPNGPMVGANGPMVGANGPMVGANGPMVGANGPMVGANGPMVGPAPFPPVKRKRRWGLTILFIVLGLLIVAGVGVGVYVLSQDSDTEIIEDDDDEEFVDDYDDDKTEAAPAETADDDEEAIIYYDQLFYRKDGGQLYAEYNGKPFNGYAWAYGDSSACAVFENGKLARFLNFHSNNEIACRVDSYGATCFDEEKNVISEDEFIDLYPELTDELNGFIQDIQDCLDSQV